MLLPPSTNAQYRGSTLAVWFLGLMALTTLVTGCIHSFLPDGGSRVIAGLDLGDRADLVIATFNWEGATQLGFGLALVAVVLRYRALTAWMLLCVAVERGLMSLQGWVLRVPADGHHPPEHYGSPIITLLALVFMVLAARERSSSHG